MVCVICGQEMSCKVGEYHYKECGLHDVYLLNVRICTCDNCHEEVVCRPAMPQLHTIIGEELLKKDSRLNGKEIRFLRRNMGLKAVELQEYLGVDNATISRWEHGSQNITPPHDRLLRMFYATFKGLPQDIVTSMLKDVFRRIQRDEVSSPLHIDIDLTRIVNTCLLPA